MSDTKGPLERWARENTKHCTEPTGYSNWLSQEDVMPQARTYDALLAKMAEALRGLMDRYGPDATAPDITNARTAPAHYEETTR